MEQMRKDHYLAFCKHLPVCDPSLGVDLLKEIHVHYDMNSERKILIEKLQMLTYSFVSTKQKLSWLKMWNESVILREANKIPKPKFSNSQFDIWLHKATFWH
jgi:hypothetical protein